MEVGSKRLGLERPSQIDTPRLARRLKFGNLVSWLLACEVRSQCWSCALHVVELGVTAPAGARAVVGVVSQA